jgi:DNA polymerase-3 subunit alpha
MVEAILKQRERGQFSSFFDFQARVKGLNRKSLESLIKAGAFHELEPNTGKLVKLFKRGQANTATQVDLFSANGNGSYSNAETNSYEAEEDAMAYQKEAFGFYFSEHPLEHYQEEISALDLVSISSVDTHKSGDFIAIGGLLSAKKIKKDKKGRNYAIVNVEDFDGAIDIFVFSDNFDKYAPLLTIDTPLIIRGRVSGDEERKSMRAEQIIPLKDARNYYKKVVISFDRSRLPDRNLEDLHRILDENKGPCEVWFKINGKMECKNLRSRSIKINPTSEVLDQIKGIVGPGALQIYGSI